MFLKFCFFLLQSGVNTHSQVEAYKNGMDAFNKLSTILSIALIIVITLLIVSRYKVSKLKAEIKQSKVNM